MSILELRDASLCQSQTTITALVLCVCASGSLLGHKNIADQMLSLRRENSVLQEENLRLKAASTKPLSEGQERGIQLTDAANREAYITMVLGTDFRKAGTAGSEVMQLCCHLHVM